MKLEIAVPESLRDFVERQAEQSGYASPSDYILDLILQEQAKVEKIEALLLEEMSSGQPIEVTEEWREQKRQQHLPNTDREIDSGDGWDAIEALAGTVDMPPDWALEHDHYLYGTPKRYDNES